VGEGFTWRDLNNAYHRTVIELGGFVRDPGGMVWGHPRGADPTMMLQTGLEDFEVESGTHVMFDCHGTLDLYCWDGGKTWVVDGEPQGEAKRRSQATSEVAQALMNPMRSGVKVSELQARGREVFRKAGVPDTDAALIFFHGLGLSHMDLELTTADGKPNLDWVIEEGMVVPLHLLLPGGERERSWLEEVVVVEPDGGRPLFSWGLEPLTGG
jgi:Xaa-Pro aminopeptidase